MVLLSHRLRMNEAADTGDRFSCTVIAHILDGMSDAIHTALAPARGSGVSLESARRLRGEVEAASSTERPSMLLRLPCGWALLASRGLTLSGSGLPR